MNGSISAKTLAFKDGSSKTASMTRSQPAASAGSAVGVIRPRISAFFSSVILPRPTALESSLSEYDLPFSAASIVTSLRTTEIPARAHEYAMPAPIIPAPRTRALVGLYAGTSFGRSEPPEIADRSKKNDWIMFFAF
jgi:hypothetical protein